MLFRKYPLYFSQQNKSFLEGQYSKKYSTKIKTIEDLFFQYDNLYESLQDEKLFTLIWQAIQGEPKHHNEVSLLLAMNGLKGKAVPEICLIALYLSYTYTNNTFTVPTEVQHYIYLKHFDF